MSVQGLRFSQQCFWGLSGLGTWRRASGRVVPDDTAVHHRKPESSYWSKGNEKVVAVIAMKAYFLLWHEIEVSDPLHATTVLPPGEGPVTRRMGSWVGFRADLDRTTHNLVSIPNTLSKLTSQRSILFIQGCKQWAGSPKWNYASSTWSVWPSWYWWYSPWARLCAS